MDILIRTLEKRDIELIAQLFTFPWTTYEETIEKWTAYYLQKERTVYVLEKEKNIVGYCSLLRIANYPLFQHASIPEINDLWIATKERNQGLATLLISVIEKQAEREGFTTIGIGVGLTSDYGAAQRLYSKLGYIPDGRGVTYRSAIFVKSDETYPVHELVLWLTKNLNE